jgi:hypothetical protein
VCGWVSKKLKEWWLVEVGVRGDSRDLVWAVVPGGSQVKGAGSLGVGGARLKIR